MNDAIHHHTLEITAALREFMADKEGPRTDPANPFATYTTSPEYLLHTITAFHSNTGVQGIIGDVLKHIQPGETVVDVGCSCGFTGLTIAMQGRAVTFHDFESLGLQFIRWFAERKGLIVSVIPYGDSIMQHDWAVALDVIEHTGEHVGFLHWMKTLGKSVAFTHPNIRWHKPYEVALDEHVDHEVLMWVIERRYELLYESNVGGRYFVVYR